jgi:hypothetical protein
MLELWGESEAEVIEFLKLVNFHVDNIFVAKRGIGNNYLQGRYFVFDQIRGATTETEIMSPKQIQDLVQWCSSDMYISKNGEPMLAVETTYHTLVYNNIAQRIPRQIRAAMLGVPNVIFQKIDRSGSTDLISWYMKAFEKASKIFGTNCLVIAFDGSDYAVKARNLMILCSSSFENRNTFDDLSKSILADMKIYSDFYDEKSLVAGKAGKGRRWLKVDDSTVTIFIGVKRNCGDICGTKKCITDSDRAFERKKIKEEKTRGLRKKGCVWLTKGTGGMDPYPGLVKMAEMLFCYDEAGKKVKRLRVVFKNLPEDFWWFEKYPDEIYYKIVKEFADEIVYYNSPLKRKQVTTLAGSLEKFF